MGSPRPGVMLRTCLSLTYLLTEHLMMEAVRAKRNPMENAF